MSESGQNRRIPHVCAMSGCPPIAFRIANVAALGPCRHWGQSLSALPRSSDFDLLGYGQGIVYLDAEIPHGALNLGVTE